jgi:hypothetical protein
MKTETRVYLAPLEDEHIDPDLPPQNCTSYNVRKTETVIRGDFDGKERIHTGADYK